MRKRNEHGSKFNHPPAPQPRHPGVARQALWWNARHPGIPLRCAKRDVPRAFKWHFLAPRDVPEFAVRLLGAVIISLVMPFGWVGAPGEFVAWSAAAKAHHGSFHPPDPWFNDEVSYDSKWLMDDGVVLEPLVGNRVFHSLACLDQTMVAIWGPEGVNVEKMAEEGEPSGCQLLWGLYMDFDRRIISLPEPKRMKAKYLLAEPALCRGHKEIPLRLLQEVAGCAQYWSIVCPELLPRLPALYRPMRGQAGRGAVDTSDPGGADPHMSEEDWEDFWQTLDFIRLQLERPLSSSFKASFDKLLPFRERLALPGVADRLRILGGDATLDRFGSLDWKDRRFASEDATPYLAQLKAQLPNFDHGEIISIVELMAFVAFAGKECPNWNGDLVLYVTDNDNVKSWLTKRRPRNHFARLMICLVQRLEVEYNFSCHAVYIRTYHNEMADWVSRAPMDEVAESMRERGWAKVECLGFWESLLAGARHPSLVLPGDDPLEQEARQLASAPVSVPAPFRVWLHQPWAIGTCVPLALDSAAIALARFGSGAIEAHEASSEGPRRFWASLSQDPHEGAQADKKRLGCGTWELGNQCTGFPSAALVTPVGRRNQTRA